MRASTASWVWPTIAVGFILLIVGIVVAVDVQKVVGIVIVCIAAALFLILRARRVTQ